MNIEDVQKYCLGKCGSTEDMAFGPDNVLFRLCDKIFACLDLNRPDMVVVKLEESAAADLRSHYQGIVPAWHWNKRYWNEVYLDSDVPEHLIKSLIDASYENIRLKLPQKSLYHFSGLPEGWWHLHYPVLDSAMNVLRDEHLKTVTASYQLVTVDYQTAGRGQGTNSWESEDKKNLLFAFRFFPTMIKATNQFLLLECVSVAVALTVEKFYKKTVKIKWPNDIYCEDKKICGILIEHDICGANISETRCGIGLNINQDDFLSSAPNPVSLKQLLGKEIDRAAVLRTFLNSFMEQYRFLKSGTFDTISQNYMTRLYRLAGWYPFKDVNGLYEGHIYSISNEGYLSIMDRNRCLRTYAHKEVEFVLTKREYIPSEKERREWMKLKDE